MSSLRGFKQKLSTVSRLWDAKDYDTAFAEVESLRKTWPGNAHLHILWASLVQLQEGPQYSLAEAKQALQQAMELDKDAPAGAIELGHFLDNVEDDPHAANRVYADGVAVARRLLIDGLIGQAKALRQLDRKEEFRRCLLEVLHLARFEIDASQNQTHASGKDVIFESPSGHFYAIQLNGPYAEQIEDLLSEVPANRSA
jgi:hypothetical protein